MVTVVMPAHNEADIIEGSVREWYDGVIAKIPGAELLVVDDASTDETGTILSGLAESLRRLRVITSAVQRGHGPSVYAGLRQANTEYVFHTDSDRQHLPGEFWMLWNERSDCDFVVGVRTKRADGAVRSAIAMGMRLANLLIWGLWIRDANCPFKLMRVAPLRTILDRIPQDSFIPMIAVSILARKMKFRVREVPVTHLPRSGGSQSLKGAGKWLRIAPRCLSELLRLRRAYNK